MEKSLSYRSRIVVGGFVLALASTLLAGCSAYYLGEGAPHLTVASVDGTWTRSGPNGIVARYVFTSDGKFRAESIPLISAPGDGVDDIEVNWDALMNGAGTWSIEKNDQDPPIIDLEYDQASQSIFEPATESVDAGHYSELLSVEQNHVKGLFLNAGDADEKFRLIFHKTTG